MHIVSLFLFLGIAVWEDYRTRKISNLLIIIAFVYAVLYQFDESGVQGVSKALLHAVIIFLVLFPLYLCKAFGAGDIKLLCVTAVYLSWQLTFQAFLTGLYISLIPIVFSYLFDSKDSVKKIPMSGPILGGILIILCKEGCI